MASLWNPLQIAQIAGLAGSAWLSGNIAGISLISVPALAQSQELDSVPARTISRQWLHTYEAGKVQNPPIAAVTAAAFSYAAWSTTAAVGHATKHSIAAAALTLGIVPFTLVVMEPTNGKLRAKAAKAAKAKGDAAWTASDDEEVGQLVGTWIWLNGVRSLFPLLGFVMGAAAALA